MKQAIIKKGKVLTEDIPAPLVSDGALLIKVVNSCISAGTEMVSVSSSGTPVIQRVLKQPEKVAKILKMARSEGIMKIYRQVKGEIDAGLPVGYSVSGVVIAVGKGVDEFRVGDRVAAAGGGLAYHAEYVDVPVNLVVKIPGKLSYRESSSVALGAIALHGVRRAGLELGEYCVVMGTGILGLITVQLLAASGVRVLAIDLDDKRLELAGQMGAELVLNPTKEDPVGKVVNFSGVLGADAVIFTASTSSNEPLSQAFRMCRRKGKVVLVGVSGMQIDRKDIYPKEIDFIISTSYGPGRYDQDYERKGMDYPYAYVRWTEGRNLSEYLRLIESGRINLQAMISREYGIEQVKTAFESLEDPGNKPLMVLLDYGAPDEALFESYREQERLVPVSIQPVKKDVINVALIGAGSFARNMHLPHLGKLDHQYKLYAVADISGPTAKTTAEQFRASYATTDPEELFKDEKVDLVLICTRHDSHGGLVLSALKNEKHVFVEKPLAISTKELDEIEAFYQEGTVDKNPLLMVGFNRRFSPYASKIKSVIEKRVGPAFIKYDMNAGYISPDHWVHENGGRIVGEACHIIDLFHYLLGERVKSVSFESTTPSSGKFTGSDNKSMVFSFTDGSVATLGYFALGSKDYPKEHMQVHFDERSIIMKDYLSMKGYGIKSVNMNTSRPSKGHFEELKAFYDALKQPSQGWPISLHDMLDTTRLTFLISNLK
jgi:predicted dehydrogenase/threonine dehydrogenase-like Zn-dependent dehydrogenase